MMHETFTSVLNSHLGYLLAILSKSTTATAPGRFCYRWLNILLSGIETDQLSLLIQKILGESPTRAKEISTDWLLHRQLSQLCWQRMAGSSIDRARSNALDSLFPHKRQVVRYLQNCSRGVLITSIHMGDYLNGLLHLCMSTPSHKQVFILRNRKWDRQEERAFQKFSATGIKVTVLRRQRSVAITAIRQLRRGNIVVALYDLPGQWGSTTKVTFFDQQMALVKGPAELAILAEADILPIMFHYAADGTRVIDTFPIYRPTSRGGVSPEDISLGGLSLELRVQQTTQYLIDQAERQIRKFPGQWHHWHLIPAMLADE